jgi:hypothetical protein
MPISGAIRSSWARGMPRSFQFVICPSEKPAERNVPR